MTMMPSKRTSWSRLEPPATPMIVSVLQENLKKALDLVVSYLPSYPPLPVLANVLLEAEDSRLKISATDLETSISIWIGAKPRAARRHHHPRPRP